MLTLAMCFAATACAHLRPEEPRRELPLEIYQENHLAEGEWRVTEVRYSLNGVELKTWRAMGPDDQGSSRYPIVQEKVAAGTAELAVTVTLLHVGQAHEREEQVVRLAMKEILMIVPGLRSRHVFRLCPLQTEDRLRAISAQLDTAYYRLQAAPAYMRGECLAVHAPAPGGLDDRR